MTGPEATRRRVAPWLATLGVAAVTFPLGLLTSWAQAWLPEAWAPLANSAFTWTALTAVAVAVARLPVGWSGVAGALGFVLLVVGYTVASAWRGLTYSPLLFGVVGVLVGPFIGVATAWLRARGVRLALGAGLLSGIGLGEGGYGLTVVADTTEPAAWVVAIVLAVALLVWVAVRRGPRAALGAAGVAALVAAAFVLAWVGLGGV